MQKEQFLLHQLFGKLDLKIALDSKIHYVAPFSTGLTAQYIRLALAPRPFFIDSLSASDTILLALPKNVNNQKWVAQREIFWTGCSNEYCFYLAIKTDPQL